MLLVFILTGNEKNLTMLRKFMYICASFKVSLLDNLSEGWVGTMSRNFVKASLRLCVLSLSRLFAEK